MRFRMRSTGAVAMAVVVAGTLAACSGPATDGASGPPSGQRSGQPVTLTVYSGQHEDLVDALAATFTKKTGIQLNIRSGEDADLVNQIVEEGSRTRADVFLSEEPGPIGSLAAKGLLVRVPASTLGEVDQQLVPSGKDWLPYATRSRVLYYDPNLISKDQLPHSIMDLTQPQWKGKFAYAPSGAFTATVSYLVHSIGEQKTLAWLQGIEANGVNEQSNGKVRDTVEAGQHELGISNHYYWWRLAETQGGPSQMTSKIYYFDHPDAGSLVLASGAGVLKTSTHRAAAQELLAWLGSATGGQRVVGGPDANKDGAQIPVAPGAESQIAGVPTLSQLHPPKVDQSIFADTAKATELIEESGIS